MISFISQFKNARDVFLAALAFVAAAMLAIIIHECAHGYVAYLNGDPTAKNKGRLTLNPKVHFNLFGVLMFVVAGIGWANPVPINPYNFKKIKKGLLTTALAGVIANFILAFLFFALLAILSLIMKNINIMDLKLFPYAILFFLQYFFLISIVINISLIAFNLIPICPLDGFRVVETLTPPNNAYVQFMYKNGTYLLLGLLIIGGMIPRIDIIGMYMNAMRNLILNLFELIFGFSIF